MESNLCKKILERGMKGTSMVNYRRVCVCGGGGGLTRSFEVVTLKITPN